MSTFLHDGIEFFYESMGSGIPFIFLHGLGGSVEQPKGLLDVIPGIQFIMLDQRGHGRTKVKSDSRMDFDCMGDDVIAFADQIGLKTFLIGGISMGAGVSVNVALRYPERIDKQVLIRNAWLDAPMDERIQRWYDGLADFLELGSKEKFGISELYKEISGVASDTANTFMRVFTEKASLDSPQKYRIMPKQRPYNAMEQLKQIRIPTLILSNRQDPIHLYEYGSAYHKYIAGSKNFEITSKVISKEQHKAGINKYLNWFLKE